ncbi:hypothetical protein HHI36_005538 [Cryptolaemus montrouzieri]|uniref:Uncharacterized protein n=1 Tax=Cryptolaemus montrouzieri TaxID=559131 RepID=A0ABD2NW14_9CUCU
MWKSLKTLLSSCGNTAGNMVKFENVETINEDVIATKFNEMTTNALKCKTINMISTRLQCNGKCKSWFHGTNKCTSLKKEAFMPISEKKVKWFCESCEESESDDEVEDTDESSEDEAEEEEKLSKTSPNKGRLTQPKKTSNEAKLDVILSKNKRFLKKLEKIENENVQLKKDMKQLKHESLEMHKEIDFLKKQKDITKQDSLKNNIVISGLPMNQITDKESVTKTVIKIVKN